MRSEWMIKILGLSVSNDPPETPGLILVQIDGLSHIQLSRALKKRRMPFLDSLIKKQHYKNHLLYTGLPSSTPAMQGELFYGVKGCVPEFSFIERKSNKLMTMNQKNASVEYENILSKKGKGLLEDGSCYSNIFSGGAKEPHFCAGQFSWEGFFETVKLPAFPLALFFYADILLRILALLIVEFILAVTDFFRGLLARSRFLSELIFIPIRVSVCVLLRELITAGAQIDVVRGLPIIHLNYLGYDEQAHHRGPSSEFAHWSLRGIDDAIARLWRSAENSSRRRYDLWIYSDHGQEKTSLYRAPDGKTIREVVSEIFEQKTTVQSVSEPDGRRPFAPKHAHFIKNLLPSHWIKTISRQISPPVLVTAMGPIGNIYPPYPLSDGEKVKIAVKLARLYQIPLVFVATPQGVRAWTAENEYRLPDQSAEIFGSQHPFLEDITQDLIELCRHPDAGSIVISGWQKTGKVLTFHPEGGTHAGPGINETSAFCFLPPGAPLKTERQDYLRPLDLRHAVLRFLGRAMPDALSPVESAAKS